MGPPRRTLCGAGEHDLRNPDNVGTYKRRGRADTHFCLPCNRRRGAERRRRERAQLPPLVPLTRRPPRGGALSVLQAIADGMSVTEICERYPGLSPDGVRECLRRQRRRYGAGTTAAAVGCGLAAGDICPARGAQPFPEPCEAVQRHVRSLLRLLRGERRPMSPRRAQAMLDDLYAFSEPHAVSVLWRVRLITADDVVQFTKKESDMTREMQPVSATR
ncbi:DUF433 domain-containing protein [Streptomyces sp. NPDC046925]|uniref:DUF433 domain-containing protein n=1 Tax=Streptomyces sp. NPDC046925 TaxID=3155375 RepID=UPI00341170B1